MNSEGHSSTMEDLNEEDIRSDLEELQDLYPHLPGPILQKVLRFKAQSLLDKPDDELQMILHLVESHIPGLRLRAEIEYQANSYEQKSVDPNNKKSHLYNIFSNEISDVKNLVEIVAQLPKEWAVVQLTPQFSSKEIFALKSDDLILNGVHITVFNCGKKDAIPYCVTLPKGNAHSIRGEMRRLKSNLKEIYSIPHKKVTETMSMKSRKMYHKRRMEMEDVLECFLREIEESWLGAWKCLFIGKFKDESVENEIEKLLNKFFKERSLETPSQKVQNILKQMVKNILMDSTDDSIIEKQNAAILDYCFPGKNLRKVWKTFWNKNQISLENPEIQPVILIVDEVLDAFPWEMISSLNGQPSSRMSSLHSLYALFKAHEDSIVDGYKILSNTSNGRYILNPGLDLKLMEKRLKAFFEYWLPEWNGSAGKTPSSKEFIEALTSAEIFCFSGHGSGAQYCSSEKIKKEKIDAVVFLFGCGSTQLVEEGPAVEMYGVSQMYSLANCPCLIGMLWVVTDIDTDILTSNLLSTWIPNKEKPPWQLINEKEWIDKGTVNIGGETSGDCCHETFNEPDLLKALWLAKNKMKNNCNKAAVVARGIPVKYQ